MELDEFKTRMDYLYQRVVGGERMEGVDRIYYPGEIELLTAQKRRAEGIPYAQVEIEALNREADEVGVAHLDDRKIEQIGYQSQLNLGKTREITKIRAMTSENA
ncbi:hypothetical protein ACJ72_00601 [Emergomyces africanus]|uniref:Uncharacterized protein n=1 Tax=Emergomyces africanus TaxID=1955775 RepID=A0A1B7P7P1_9EURO|nr:hypothetical protein ACJ72_00601 [Emergomyces africanus]